MILEILKEASIAQHTSKEFSETLLFIFKYLPIENGLSLISPLYTTCKQEHSAHRKDRTRPSKLPRTRSKQLAHKEKSQAHSHTPLHCSASRGPNKSLYFKCLSEQKEHTLSLS